MTEVKKKLTRKEKIAAGVEKPKENRKRRASKAYKEEKKSLVYAVLKDCPSSPRKARLVADLIRGKNIEDALAILSLSVRAVAVPLRKLLLSAIDNWKQKHSESGSDIKGLFVKTIFVDSASMLKRLRPAPQGRAFRVRKRSNHITIILDKKNAIAS